MDKNIEVVYAEDEVLFSLDKLQKDITNLAEEVSLSLSEIDIFFEPEDFDFSKLFNEIEYMKLLRRKELREGGKRILPKANHAPMHRVFSRGGVIRNRI